MLYLIDIPYLLLATNNNIWRVFLDGSMYSTIYSGGSGVAIDFDFRYVKY